MPVRQVHHYRPDDVMICFDRILTISTIDTSDLAFHTKPGTTCRIPPACKCLLNTPLLGPLSLRGDPTTTYLYKGQSAFPSASDDGTPSSHFGVQVLHCSGPVTRVRLEPPNPPSAHDSQAVRSQLEPIRGLTLRAEALPRRVQGIFFKS